MEVKEEKTQGWAAHSGSQMASKGICRLVKGGSKPWMPTPPSRGSSPLLSGWERSTALPAEHSRGSGPERQTQDACAGADRPGALSGGWGTHPPGWAGEASRACARQSCGQSAGTVQTVLTEQAGVPEGRGNRLRRQREHCGRPAAHPISRSLGGGRAPRLSAFSGGRDPE